MKGFKGSEQNWWTSPSQRGKKNLTIDDFKQTTIKVGERYIKRFGGKIKTEPMFAIPNTTLLYDRHSYFLAVIIDAPMAIEISR